MLPGKVYTPEDVLRIARKRIWFLLLPLALVSAATAVWSRKLPDRYRSESSILVVPQRVPESYVRSTVTTRIEDRLQSIQQQILSRTRLERIITEFNLYAKERQSGIMEDIVQKMRLSDIHSEVLRGDAFRISFVGDDPRTVMRVTERLASLFINENIEDRSRMADNTNQFLEGELATAKAQLIEQEKRVEEYRRRFSGQLPSQLESNLQVLQASQMQIQQVFDLLNRERDHQVRLERDIADLEQLIAEASSGDTAPGQDGGTVRQQLEAARANLAALLMTNKKEIHPDVIRTRGTIRDLEQKLAAQDQANDAPVSPDFTRLSPSATARARRLEDLNLELGQVKRNIANGEREEQRLRKDVAAYQQRNEAIPTRETEMTELTRDYSTMLAQYQSLLLKHGDSKMSASLENRQIGEQFKVIDPARLPERPFSPNRQRYNMMGLVGGLGLGVLLVALFEYKDKSFKTDEEVARLLTLPVLAVVPLMQSGREKKRALRNQVMLSVGFGTTVLGCLAVVVYTLVR